MRLSRPASFVCQPWKDGQVGHGSQRMVKLGKVHRAWARLKDMYIGSGRSELLLDDHLIVLTIVVEGMPLDLLSAGGQMGGLDLEVASILVDDEEVKVQSLAGSRESSIITPGAILGHCGDVLLGCGEVRLLVYSRRR